MTHLISYADIQAVYGPGRAICVLEAMESLAAIRAELLALDEQARFAQALTALCAINFSLREQA